MAKKFSASIPRRMYWSREAGGTEFCPRCHSRLEKDFHSYLAAVRDKGEESYLIIGNNDGYFCPNESVVVLDGDAFSDILLNSRRASPSAEFIVVGIVDLDAIPKEKSHIPFGDDNPIPLVQFTNIHEKETPTKKHKTRRVKRLRKAKQRNGMKETKKAS